MSRVSKYITVYSLLYLPAYVILLLGVDLSFMFMPGATLSAIVLFHITSTVLLCFIVRANIISDKMKLVAPTSEDSYIWRATATRKLLRFEPPVLCIYVLLACSIPLLGLNNHRHASNFSENAALILSLEVVRSFLLGLIVVKSCDEFGIKYGKNRYCLLVIFVIASVIGSTGSFSVIQVTVVAAMSFIIRSKPSKGKIIFGAFVAVIPLGLAVVIGFANKFSFDKDIVYGLFMGDLTYVVNYLVWRITTMAHATSVWLTNTESLSILQINMSESIYRVSSIFGGGC